VNEKAIRFDIAKQIELGLTGSLMVSEAGTTLDEIVEVTEIAADEAAGRLNIVVHAALPTLENNIELVRRSKAVGADLVLVSYPLTFYPTSEADVFDYTKAIGDSTDLGLIVFAMWLWNFQRLHPSHFSCRLLDRMVTEIPNVAVIKNEVGSPGVGGIAEVFERFNDRILVTDPIESNSPAWAVNYGLQWMGTSNYEAYGPWVPRYHALLREGKLDEAMEIFWRLQPMREATTGPSAIATSMVHRYLWKYQGWLNGFNGGPLRAPLSRINDKQMRQLRAGAIASDLDVTDSPDAEFFVGRNPQ
jgi:4-hydroxy-tetrahydrodipicolinate synthase